MNSSLYLKSTWANLETTTNTFIQDKTTISVDEFLNENNIDSESIIYSTIGFQENIITLYCFEKSYDKAIAFIKIVTL